MQKISQAEYTHTANPHVKKQMLQAPDVMSPEVLLLVPSSSGPPSSLAPTPDFVWICSVTLGDTKVFKSFWGLVTPSLRVPTPTLQHIVGIN
jgi:hypothetical protein